MLTANLLLAMSSPLLFCLRAAASRAARKAKRTCDRYGRAGSPAVMAATVQAVVRHAERTRFAFFDAQWEVQRAGFAALGRLPILAKGKSYAVAA